MRFCANRPIKVVTDANTILRSFFEQNGKGLKSILEAMENNTETVDRVFQPRWETAHLVLNVTIGHTYVNIFKTDEQYFCYRCRTHACLLHKVW
mmetsp:Transcript_35181/g.47259  ORF Transcript_35181/g.47259 Transcript_35181/m.47259 type:complete len:94 (-) Transcript_35181:1272-1553(-)